MISFLTLSLWMRAFITIGILIGLIIVLIPWLTKLAALFIILLKWLIIGLYVVVDLAFVAPVQRKLGGFFSTIDDNLAFYAERFSNWLNGIVKNLKKSNDRHHKTIMSAGAILFFLIILPDILNLNNSWICWAQNCYLQTEENIVGLADNKSPVLVSSNDYSFIVDGKTFTLTGYKVRGYDYFKLRDIAEILGQTHKQFDIGWNELDQSIIIYQGKPYNLLNDGTFKNIGTANAKALAEIMNVHVNQKVTSLRAFDINNYSYFKLNDIEALLNLQVKYHGPDTIELII